MAMKTKIDFRPAEFDYNIKFNSERTSRKRTVKLVGKSSDEFKDVDVKISFNGDIDAVDNMMNAMGATGESFFISATFKLEAQQKTLFAEEEKTEEGETASHEGDDTVIVENT